MDLLKGKPSTSLILLVFTALVYGGISLSPTHHVAIAQETGRKIGGIQGNPARKRGIEMGFDKGYLAGKSDMDEGLEPDPKRHEAFNEPEKYHRSEFGSRTAFINGFRGGFMGGYQKAYGKRIRVTNSTPEHAGRGMEAAPAKPPKPAKRSSPDSVSSDAL